MKKRNIASLIITVLAATLAFVLSAALAWAVATDYQSRGFVPEGVTVAGQGLGGMTEAEAREVIGQAFTAPMLSPVNVGGDGKNWMLDPREYVSIDVDRMVDDAYTSRRSATLIARLNSDLRGAPLAYEVKPVYSIDTTALAGWVAQIAHEVDRKPVNAERKIVKYKFKIVPEAYGARVDQAASVATLAQALSADVALSGSTREASLTVGSIKPKVLAKSFKTAIIVSLSRCRIYLYKGSKLVKSYSCAPGRPAFPTPQGDFFIQSKQRFASWFNPGSAWAASMPAVIGPGPNNPMGTTKIGINHSGIFMHGVPAGEFGSIGTHASHGCMRMMPSDVLDLYGRVHLKDPVFIRP